MQPFMDMPAFLRPIERRVLGPEHPGTSMSMNVLANNLSSKGKNTEAEMLHRKRSKSDFPETEARSNRQVIELNVDAVNTT
jgi:hypothetical protein